MPSRCVTISVGCFISLIAAYMVYLRTKTVTKIEGDETHGSSLTGKHASSLVEGGRVCESGRGDWLDTAGTLAAVRLNDVCCLPGWVFVKEDDYEVNN